MLSTPLISCSMGVATVWAITSADAPAKLALTTTVGGAISGYSVIGSARSEMYPTSVRMIEITPAKIGRSTKKWENRIGLPLRRRGGCLLSRRGENLPVFGFDFLAGPRPLQTVDDYAIGWRKT